MSAIEELPKDEWRDSRKSPLGSVCGQWPFPSQRWLLTHGPWPLPGASFPQHLLPSLPLPRRSPVTRSGACVPGLCGFGYKRWQVPFFFPYKVDACVALKGSDWALPPYWCLSPCPSVAACLFCPDRPKLLLTQLTTQNHIQASLQAVSTSREKKIPFCSSLISSNLVRGQHKLGTRWLLRNTEIILEWVWDWSLKPMSSWRQVMFRMSGEAQGEKLHLRGARGLSGSSHTLAGLCLHSQCLKMQKCPLASSWIIKAYYFEISQGKGCSWLRTEYAL